MRLEYVCDMELAYCEEPIYGGKFLLNQCLMQPLSRGRLCLLSLP